ncbi:hypothetical protein CO038_01100 [Candidatus Pacearchaeota archaeon CG_4_9_14_0_2_um_filter_39_13]|nr:glycosyltransferase [Candidatus Pacearchaeota archaeon]OIO43196.1 MAG: hypothetical protein AUJ64_02520 [Candidatus Pacearchaeota archaeon CG1_02_39_14]PJC44891.1 MAG: hypothetical protein CO038_01100 [Candidatus Pacearchaeota archaeon CG_4_9_14_0_2_um_filter_39_13]
MKNKNLPFSKVEKTLKKQKLVFAFLNCSVKGDSLYQNYCLPLKKLFGKVFLFDPLKETALNGYKKMEGLFISLVKKEKPEYIFINSRRDELTFETLDRLRKASPKTKIISISGDDDKDFDSVKRYHALFMDCTIIHQINYLKNYYRESIKNIFPTLGINTEIFRPMNLKKIYDVVFVGNAVEERVGTMRFLINNGVNLKIFGGRWDNYPEFKDFCRGYISPVEMAGIINQTKINLGLSKNKYGKSAFKWRIFEIASCKSFSLVDYFEGYFKFFKNNKEIVMVRNDIDLLEKIKYYLKNEKEREKVAGNSYKAAIKRCNILEEFLKMFKKIIENPEIFLHKLPKTKGTIGVLTKEDMKKSDSEIKTLAKRFNYITFSNGNANPLRYKDYLQAYSLEKTKKQISCCDYYIHDKILKDYLASNILRALGILDKRKVSQALTINQISVSNEYFMKNISKFRSFFEGKEIDMLNEKNTCFISIPLLRLNKINNMDSEVFNEFFHQKNFIVELSSLLRRKRLLGSKYAYRLIYLALKNPVLLRFFLKSAKEKLIK